MARKPYHLMSDHSGRIDFRREPARNGGGIIALFPMDPNGRGDRYVALPESDAYCEVPVRYARVCRRIDPDSKGDRDRAAALLARINRDDEYALAVGVRAHGAA